MILVAKRLLVNYHIGKINKYKEIMDTTSIEYKIEPLNGLNYEIWALRVSVQF